MGRLKIISDHLVGSFDLPPTPWKIGRGNDCDIQLSHKSVSRHHCVITDSDGQLRVEDLGSTYGSFINGAQINDAHAGDGDKVKLGRVVMVYEARAAAAHSPPAAVAEPEPAPAKPKFVAQPPPPKPAPAKPKLPPPGPRARFKDSPHEDEEETPARKAAVGGVYNRLQGGHKRKSKAEKPDYEKESEEWNRAANAMSGGPDYAAEAEDWEQVWGKQKKRKGFWIFGGGSSGGGLSGIFAGLPLPIRMTIVIAVLAGLGGGGKIAYDRATAHILVAKKGTQKKSLRPTPDNKDAILEKAVETFGKSIPKELRSKD